MRKQMQKLLIIFFFALLFFGCDGVEDGLIDPSLGEFNVTNIEAPNTLSYSGANTKLVTSITFSDSKYLLSVWVKIGSQDGTFDITYHQDMTKAGDNEYTASIPMDSLMPSINYTIDYFYQTESQDEKKIASHDFAYDNMQGNVAPVLSNPNIPSEINRDVDFAFSVRVTDENGYDDVEKVYYELFKPNGDQIKNSQGIKQFQLFDNGKTGENGDMVEKDSIYTVLLNFPTGAAETGTWKFEIRARDRRGELSNMITHNVVVK